MSSAKDLPQILTARLRLRPYTPDDLDDLHRLWTDPEVRRYLWDGEIILRERAATELNSSIASFESNGFGQWVVLPKEERTVIGFCGLRLFGEPPEVELLYGILPAYWGQGLATEAVKAVLRYGFTELRLSHIVGRTDLPNLASARVMEKAGMTFEKRLHINHLESVQYVLTQEAFQPGGSPYEVRRA